MSFVCIYRNHAFDYHNSIIYIYIKINTCPQYNMCTEQHVWTCSQRFAKLITEPFEESNDLYSLINLKSVHQSLKTNLFIIVFVNFCFDSHKLWIHISLFCVFFFGIQGFVFIMKSSVYKDMSSYSFRLNGFMRSSYQ